MLPVPGREPAFMLLLLGATVADAQAPAVLFFRVEAALEYFVQQTVVDRLFGAKVAFQQCATCLMVWEGNRFTFGETISI